MKYKCFALLLTFLLFLSGCRPVASVELPERPPTPTEAPVPTETPAPTPTPEPTPEPIVVPETLEELSTVIGVNVYPPAEPLTGMSFTSIGYDGKESGALRYTDENGAYLLYTVSDGIIDPTFDDCFKITVNGIEVSITETEDESKAFNGAYWIKNSNTYCLYAEPALTEDEMNAAVSAMISAPQNAKAPSIEVADVAELTGIVGFSVNTPQSLPKDYKLSHIYALYGQIPVHIYSDASTELTFVKSEGTLLPPRFSNIEYTSAGEYELPDGTKAQLYYTENGISLAEWTKGGFGYSITATDTDGNPIDLKKKTFYSLIDGFYEEPTPETTEEELHD